MWTRLRHGWRALRALPGVLSEARQRALLAEMRAFCQHLPAALNPPLIEALQSLTPTSPAASPFDETTLRNLADLAALLDRRSPLGLCLRRSLTRYHYLRRAGVPVTLQFGAKFSRNGQPDRDIHGHAWLALNDAPYFEDDENWRGFTVMFIFPPRR
jgi:hypothetical protein